MKGFTPRHLLSITSQVGGYPWERRGGERKGGERQTIGTWPTSTSPVPVEVGGERRDSQKGRCVSRIDLWGLDLLCLFTLSITQIIRSEKQSGREEGRSVWWWDWWIDVSLGQSVHCSIRRQMSQGQVWGAVTGLSNRSLPNMYLALKWLKQLQGQHDISHHNGLLLTKSFWSQMVLTPF